jgi:hypothetical protein
VKNGLNRFLLRTGSARGISRASLFWPEKMNHDRCLLATARHPKIKQRRLKFGQYQSQNDQIRVKMVASAQV